MYDAPTTTPTPAMVSALATAPVAVRSPTCQHLAQPHRRQAHIDHADTTLQQVVLSAISSGDTTDFQTWDIPAWTSKIELHPKFSSAREWISIKEVMYLASRTSAGPEGTPLGLYSAGGKFGGMVERMLCYKEKNE